MSYFFPRPSLPMYLFCHRGGRLPLIEPVKLPAATE